MKDHHSIFQPENITLTLNFHQECLHDSEAPQKQLSAQLRGEHTVY